MKYTKVLVSMLVTVLLVLGMALPVAAQALSLDLPRSQQTLGITPESASTPSSVQGWGGRHFK